MSPSGPPVTPTVPRPSSDSPGPLAVNEVFVSVQGEGASLGQPCVFLRLAGCNLACRWCDTPQAWDFARFPAATERQAVPIAILREQLLQTRRQRLVVTGGEPLLQGARLESLFAQLPPELVIEVETNGTLTPTPGLLRRVSQWNVSPKLAGSGLPRAARLHPEVLGVLLRTGVAWLKLVIATDADLAEADALLSLLRWPRERVFLMPQATTREALQARLPRLAAAALARGCGLSTRLHIALWDGDRGR